MQIYIKYIKIINNILILYKKIIIYKLYYIRYNKCILIYFARSLIPLGGSSSLKLRKERKESPLTLVMGVCQHLLFISIVLQYFHSSRLLSAEL